MCRWDKVHNRLSACRLFLLHSLRINNPLRIRFLMHMNPGLIRVHTKMKMNIRLDLTGGRKEEFMAEAEGRNEVEEVEVEGSPSWIRMVVDKETLIQAKPIHRGSPKPVGMDSQEVHHTNAERDSETDLLLILIFLHTPTLHYMNCMIMLLWCFVYQYVINERTVLV